MFSKTKLKILIRSKSFRFLRNYVFNTQFSENHAVYTWNRKPVYYRPGSYDTKLIYEILLKPGHKSPYWVPKDINPQVILDIGANIGLASLYFAKRFPSSKIYAFEPTTENYSILTKNIAEYDNIKAFQVALGKENGFFKIKYSDRPENLGGISFYDLHNDENAPRKKVEVKNASEFISEIDLNRIDLIKIDAEGSEFDIFTTMDQSLLRRVRWITGELHGIKDFELLAYLSKYFYIDIKKTLNKRYSMFHACNKEMLEKMNIKKKVLRRLQY